MVDYDTTDNFSPITPFELNSRYSMDWSPGFPKVSVEADNNALMTGHRHPFGPLVANNKGFFEMTGPQDIITLLHYSRNQSAPSRLSILFDKPASHFLFVVFGLRTNAEIKTLSYDAANRPIFLRDWDTLSRGDLVPSPINNANHGNRSSSHKIAQLSSIMQSSLDQLTLGYIVLRSARNISRIDLMFMEHCEEVNCVGSPMFYSLIAIGNCAPFSITGTLYADLDGNDVRTQNEPVYPRVQIELFTSKGVFAGSTYTSLEGYYEFRPLQPDMYTITVHLPSGVRVAPSLLFSALGVSNPIEMSPTAPNLAANGDGTFSYIGQSVPGLIPIIFGVSGHVCYDVNANGAQDRGETGVHSIDVDLFRGDELIETVQTDVTGFYRFDNLSPGNYYIHIHVPSGMRVTRGPESVASPQGIFPQFVLDHTTPGLVVVTPGTAKASMMSINNNICFTDQFAVTGRIWVDHNNDGQITDSEPGVANVTVDLVTSEGSLVRSDKTDEYGSYVLDSITRLGSYCVVFNVNASIYTIEEPRGWSLPNVDGRYCFNVSNLPMFPTTPNEGIVAPLKIQPANAGLSFRPALLGTLWIDTDRDGVAHPLEVHLSDMRVNLYQHDNRTLVDSVVTDEMGGYTFDHVAPGLYCIEFPATYTNDKSIVFHTIGGPRHCFNTNSLLHSPATISNHVDALTVAIAPGQAYASSIGLQTCAYLDSNNDDVYSANELVTNFEFQFNTASVTPNGPSSTHNFGSPVNGLVEGTYCLTAILDPLKYRVAPRGSMDPKFGNFLFNNTLCIQTSDLVQRAITPADSALGLTSDVVIDNPICIPLQVVTPFAFFGSIWEDLNNDGVQDTVESPGSNITVHLTTADGQVLASTASDENGHYHFDQLVDGMYCLDFVLNPKIYVLANVSDTTTHCFNTTSMTKTPSIGTSIATETLGVTLSIAMATPVFAITGIMWIDTDMDGVKSSNETTINGYNVTLTRSLTNMNYTSTTDSSGRYSIDGLDDTQYCTNFENLLILHGQAYLPFGPLSPYCFELGEVARPFTDSDNFILANLVVDGIDIGYYPAMAMRVHSFQDTNENGIADAGEETTDLSFTLEALNGTVLRQLSTGEDSKGLLITGLGDATYCVNIRVNREIFAISEPMPGTPYQPQGRHPSSSRRCFNTREVDKTDAIQPDAQGINYVMLDPVLSFALLPSRRGSFAIGDLAWEDSNHNGHQDRGEAGVADVIVTLVRESDQVVIATTKTDDSGYYTLDNIQKDDRYCLYFRPDFSVWTPEAPIGSSIASAPSASQCFDSISLPKHTPFNDKVGATYVVHGFNIGLDVVPPHNVSITGIAFVDSSFDGQVDKDETRLHGVLVSLLDADHSEVASIQTDNHGVYRFNNIVQGSYCLHFDKKYQDTNSRYQLEPPIRTALNQTHCFDTRRVFQHPDPYSTPPNMVISDMNAGYNFLLTLKLCAWIDNNADGIFSSEEHKYTGLQFNLTQIDGTLVGSYLTDDSGAINAHGLAEGDYCVRINVPKGYRIGLSKGNSWIPLSGSRCFTTRSMTHMPAVAMARAEANYTDTLLLPSLCVGLRPIPTPDQLFAIAGFIWEDWTKDDKLNMHEVGVPNIRVQLTNVDGEVFKETRTDIDGRYVFDEIEEGDHCITVGLGREEYVIEASNTTARRWDSGNGTTCFDSNTLDKRPTLPTDKIVAPRVLGSLNYGLISQPPHKVAIVGMAWIDTNMNGVVDENEKPKADVRVLLYKDDASTLVANKTTDANGLYFFDDLNENMYCVWFADQFIDDKGVQYFAEEPVNTSRSILYCFNTPHGSERKSTPEDGVTAKRVVPNVNIGYTPSLALTLAAWHDSNSDGMKDDNEENILSRVEFTLTKDGSTTRITPKDQVFTGLQDGLYCLKVQSPSAYTIEIPKADSIVGRNGAHCFHTRQFAKREPVESDKLPTSVGAILQTPIGIGFHPIPAPPMVAFSDYIWVDQNGNGKQDNGEGVPGIGVTLFPAGGIPYPSVVSDARGHYLFDLVPTGDYCLVYNPNHTLYEMAPPVVDNRLCFFTTDLGPRDSIASDHVKAPLIVGSIASHLIHSKPHSVGIIGYAWEDEMMDGILDTAHGLPSIYVELHLPNGTIVATNTTDENGRYVFDNLPEGRYCIVFDGSYSKDFSDSVLIAEQAYGFSKPSNYCFDTSVSSQRRSRPEDKTKSTHIVDDISVGYDPEISLQACVWLDDNHNGIIDPNEKRLSNPFQLVAELSGQTVATTNAEGYILGDIAEGRYCLVSGINNHDYSVLPAGGDNMFHSNSTLCFDTRSFNKTHPPSTLPTYALIIDKVFCMAVVPRDKLAIQGISWIDGNLNSLIDPFEPLQSGMEVTLTSNGKQLATTKTDAKGVYLFDNLIDGSYCVEFIPSFSKDTHTYVIAPPGGASRPVQSSYCFNTALVSGRKINVFDSKLIGTTLYDSVSVGYTPALSFVACGWGDDNEDGLHSDTEKFRSGVTFILNGSISVHSQRTTSDLQPCVAFNNLREGSYCITVQPPKGMVIEIPVGQSRYPAVDSGSRICFDSARRSRRDPNTKELVQGATGQIIDLSFMVGLIEPKTAVIGSAWSDLNGDGIRDAHEPAQTNSIVVLTHLDNSVISTWTTDSNGIYRIDHIAPGEYCIRFETINGRVPQMPMQSSALTFGVKRFCFNTRTAASRPSVPSDKVHAATVIAGVTAGYARPISYTTCVWLDENNDGVIDVSERLLDIPTFTLHTSEGVLVTEKIIPEGRYCLNFTFDALLFRAATPGRNNPFKDGQYCFDTRTLAHHEDPESGHILINDMICTGLQLADTQQFAMSDYIWEDTNGDGIMQDSETGISESEVYLTTKNGTIITKLQSDRHGKFDFSNITNGVYCIVFHTQKGSLQWPPPGTYCFDTAFLPKSESHQVTGLTSHLGIKVVIGGSVWLDTNYDGIIDEDEQPRIAIMARLFDNETRKEIQRRDTDRFGKYAFDHILQGSYCIDFVPSIDIEHGLIIQTPIGGSLPTVPEFIYCFDTPALTQRDILPSESWFVSRRVIDYISAGYVRSLTLNTCAWLDADKDGHIGANEEKLDDVLFELFLSSANGTLGRSMGTTLNVLDGIPEGYYCLVARHDETLYKRQTKAIGESLFDGKGKYCFNTRKMEKREPTLAEHEQDINGVRSIVLIYYLDKIWNSWQKSTNAFVG
eukprot:gene444-530_t